MLILIFSPFLALNIATIFRKPRLEIDMNLIKIPPYDQIHWGVLISTTVWCLGGYDFAGSVAGEIKGGKKAFIIGILATFQLNLINYLFVMKYFPIWLTIWMVISSIESCFGSVYSGILQLSWTMWAMGKGRKDKIANRGRGRVPMPEKYQLWQW